MCLHVSPPVGESVPDVTLFAATKIDDLMLDGERMVADRGYRCEGQEDKFIFGSCQQALPALPKPAPRPSSEPIPIRHEKSGIKKRALNADAARLGLKQPITDSGLALLFFGERSPRFDPRRYTHLPYLQTLLFSYILMHTHRNVVLLQSPSSSTCENLHETMAKRTSRDFSSTLIY